MANKKKKRIKKQGKYIIGAAIALIVAGITGIIIKTIPHKTETPAKTTLAVISQQQADEIIAEAPKTTIDMSDFKIPQGDQIVVTATTEDTDSSLIYSSSNEDVVIVEEDGTLTAVGEGTAAITVTNGNISQSVIVEVTKDEEDPGVNNFPLYSEAVKNQDQSGNISTEKPSDSLSETQSDSEQAATVPQSPSDTEKSTFSLEKLYSEIENYGFNKKVSNAYDFETDDKYMGEVILENRCIHIYVKSMSETFRTALESIAKQLLPNQYANVLDVFEQASYDKAMVADGRKIQIIVGKQDVHRQLIIYLDE